MNKLLQLKLSSIRTNLNEGALREQCHFNKKHVKESLLFLKKTLLLPSETDRLPAFRPFTLLILCLPGLQLRLHCWLLAFNNAIHD